MTTADSSLTQRSEIVFIESNVADYATLMAGLDPALEVHVLDAASDGITQMAEYLQGRSGIDAIHVISHGSSGAVQLGSLTLNESSLQSHTAELAAIGKALTADGDLLLYGCNVAQSNAGLDFIGKLAQATGADVAASDDLTGSAAKGGDWVLEAQRGSVEASAVFLTPALASYVGLLDVSDQNFDSAGLITAVNATSQAVGNWTFSAANAVDMAVANSNETVALLGGASDRVFIWNLDLNDGVADVSQFLFASTDGTNFDLNSFSLAASSNDGYGTYAQTMSVTISGWRDSAQVVAGETVDLSSSDSAGNITYTMAGTWIDTNGSPDFFYGYGQLSFGSAFDNVDEIRMTFGGTVTAEVDDIDISPAVTAPSVTLSINNASIAEAAGTATVTATLSAAAASDTTVALSTSGTATGGGTDYALSSTTITIPIGQTTGTATITAAQDALDEAHETVIVDIASVSGGGGATESGTQSVTTTITDDDAAPSVSIANVSQAEGNSGTSSMTFTATLSAASGQAVSVNYATGDGSATAGSDYTATGGTLTFAPGETTKTFTVTISGDTALESDETLTATLSNPVNATLGTASATGTITNDENATPVFSNLNGGATYTENGSAVVIDSDVTVADTELDALNSGLGNYNGASITIARNGGASSNDSFGNSGLLGALTQGQSFTYNGTTVGSVTTNSAGTLTLTFNSNATSAIADAVLQSLTYANSSDDPPTSVTLGWTFNDGSINSSGTNQAVLSITPLNDAPVVSNTAVSKTFNEDSAQTFSAADFGFSDVDSGDTLQSITIVTAPGAGELFIDANGNGVRGVGDTLLGNGSVVSAADIGKLTFRPAADANGAGYAAFTWTVSDGTASSANVGTMTLNVTAGNDAPVISNTAVSKTFNEDSAQTFTAADFGFSDVDSGDTLQSITIVTAPAAGELFIDANNDGVRGVGDTLLGNGAVVSAANVGNLTFRPAANANGAGYAAFTWTVSDGTASSANVGTMTLNATAVNDAPTLSNGATVTLTTTNEDNTSSATTVSSLLSNAGYGDVDSGAASGIAITLTSGNGHWQYSTDSGANWFNIGTVSGSSALLLTSTAQVRYVPDGANGETATFAFKAWDQTSGSATTGASTGLADTSTSGGSSAFSNASAQASMAVTSANDAPTVGSAISSQSATQDSAFSFPVPAGTFADVDPGDTLTLSATLADGSALPAWLSFNPATGTFSGTPGSGDLGNVSIRVTGTDIGNASVSTVFSLAIIGSNHFPVITSNGGGATASINVAENHTAVTTVLATDADSDPVTYSLNGGADAAKFAINATTGVLTFASAPNYEAPTDVGSDNTYEVIVRASDGTATDDQTLTVTVTDVNETVPPVQPPVQPAPLIDGVSVETTQQTGADGLTTTTVQIDPVSAGRVEDSTTPHNTLADIPLVTDATGASLLSTGLPVGIGIQSITQSGNDLTLRQQLINASESRITDDTAWQQILSDGIDAYTASVTAPSQVTVRTLVLTAASGSSAPGQPIVITGASGTGENDSAHPLRQEALIIDARTLPAGSVLDLDQVEFAIIIGPATVTGGAGRNYVIGDGSAQTIILGAEDDLLYGGAGDDTVGSHGGNDQLFGDAGNDTVVGGEGNDTLDGGDGNDLLHGGQSDAGTWTFQLNAQHQLVTTFTATTSNLAQQASETHTGAWSQGTSALTGYGGITFGDQPVDTLETLTLLCQALLQRFPDVAEMNYWANQGLTPQQLAQLAYNAHLDGQAIATSLTAQSADLITWLWGSDAATSALTQAVADYIEHGGNWADVVLAGIRHDTFRGPLEGTGGTLTLTQSHHSGESGWSSDTGNDTLSGGAGNDTLIGGRGCDTLNGGDGIDTAVFSGNRSASQLTWNGSTLLVGTGEDIDQLTHIERLRFADQKIALDVDGHAGSAMEFIATVAPQFLDDLTARGLILGLLDNGETLLGLSQKALDLHLVPSNNAGLVTTLYQHVLDSQPTAEQTQALTSYIEDHGQADFIAAVVGLHLNIDLVGLQQQGVEYA